MPITDADIERAIRRNVKKLERLQDIKRPFEFEADDRGDFVDGVMAD